MAALTQRIQVQTPKSDPGPSAVALSWCTAFTLAAPPPRAERKDTKAARPHDREDSLLANVACLEVRAGGWLY